MSAFTTLSTTRVFGGTLKRIKHISAACATDMTYAIFLPPQSAQRRVPVLYWLSGLTCTDENFCQKSGFAQVAAERGLCVVAPDTSPRGHAEIPGEHDSYDFGSGAGFYVDAVRAPWKAHYKMWSYVTEELPDHIESAHGAHVSDLRSVSGHSMGGHGALTAFFRNPGRYESVSAFSPICSPTSCPWGQKAFEGYLGSVDAGDAHDASKLARLYQGKVKAPILVDQGAADNFLVGEVDQLQPHLLEAACKEAWIPLDLRMHDGYDHSYYFIATFIADHLHHHANALGL